MSNPLAVIILHILCTFLFIFPRFKLYVVCSVTNYWDKWFLFIKLYLICGKNYISISSFRKLICCKNYISTSSFRNLASFIYSIIRLYNKSGVKLYSNFLKCWHKRWVNCFIYIYKLIYQRSLKLYLLPLKEKLRAKAHVELSSVSL